MSRIRFILLLTLIPGFFCWPALAAPVSFSKEIKPLLNKHCISCHGGVKKAGKISWLFREDALVEGKSGNHALVPGKPELSFMLERIIDKEDPMPPPEHGPMLSAAEVDVFRRWVTEGAVWEGHWAFEKPVRPALPEVQLANWPQNPIDTFLLARMEQEKLTPEPPQDPARLLRRVSLDLTGLPPTPEQTAAFVQAPSRAALEMEVDRLLASPRFGEHWAPMWLDAIRYADSKGLGQDAYRDMWPYRDWVIDALNADMPFDQFTIKQLAGDLLPNATLDDRIATACQRTTATNDEGGTDDEEFRIEALIDRVSTTWQTWQGVTFGCVQCHAHPYDPFHHEDFYRFAAILNQTRDIDSEADFPNLRVPNDRREFATAQSLDQKISSLRTALHQSGATLTARPDIWSPLNQVTASAKGCGIKIDDTVKPAQYQLTGTVPLGVKVTLDAPAPAGLTRLTALRFDALPVDPKIARTISEWGFIINRLTLAVLPADSSKALTVKLAQVFSDEPDPFLDPQGSLSPDKKQGYGAFTRMNGPRHGVFVAEAPVLLPANATLQIGIEFNSSVQGSFPLVARRGSVSLSADPAWTDLLESPAFKEKQATLASLTKQRANIKSTKLPVMEALEPAFQRTMSLFVRGNWLTRGEETPPGVPHIFPALPSDGAPDRLALARWLFLPDQPLTARVMVNRLWERIFGIGIVESMEDFGSAGDRPFNPALLDWLAVHFREDLRWSLKSMLRKMVLTAAYGQDSLTKPDKLAKDPANRFLSRGPRLRLTSEMLRDQALQVSGLLSNKMHGPPVYPPIPEGVWAPFVGNEKWPTPPPGDPERYRRAVYTLVKRSIPYPGAAVFDAPSREVCSQRRISSNTPVQALTLLNDAVFDEAATAFSNKMIAHSPDPGARLTFGYRQITGRAPEPFVLTRLHSLLTQCQTAGADEPATWKNAAIVLLNLDESLTR